MRIYSGIGVVIVTLICFTGLNAADIDWPGWRGPNRNAISTEAATGDELAAPLYGGADQTSKTEAVTTYIGILVAEASFSPTLSPAPSASDPPSLNPSASMMPSTFLSLPELRQNSSEVTSQSSLKGIIIWL